MQAYKLQGQNMFLNTQVLIKEKKDLSSWH